MKVITVLGLEDVSICQWCWEGDCPGLTGQGLLMAKRWHRHLGSSPHLPSWTWRKPPGWLATLVPREGDCEPGQQLWFKKGLCETLGQGHYVSPILLSGVLGWGRMP